MMENPKEKAFYSISFVAFSLFMAVALVSVNPSDWPFAKGQSFRNVSNLCGPFGSLVAYLLHWLLGGLFAWFAPIAMFFTGASIVTGTSRVVAKRLLKATLLIFLLNAFFALSTFTREITTLSGWVGRALSSLLSSVLGEIGSSILIIACLLFFILGEFKQVGAGVFSGTGRGISWIPSLFRFLMRGLSHIFGKMRSAVTVFGERIRERRRRNEAAPAREKNSAPGAQWIEPVGEERPIVEERPVTDLPERRREKQRIAVAKPPDTSADELDVEKVPIEEASLPDLSILEEAKREDGTPYSSERLKSWSAVLEEKLRNYNVEGRVSDVHHGPLITTFEFEPAPGVKIKDIVSRSDDLALALRARSLRMIAPIPGRAAVGIEIPNPESRTVRFREVLKEIPERLRVTGIMVALGVDVVGKPYFFNLCSAPHLLVAGTTGSGKSVCLNVILSSILFQHHPSEVKLIIVDPKVVEMNIYNGIPHLVHPVITDPKIAARVFSYLTVEMQRRNELFRESGVKNIESYNSKIALGRTKPGEQGRKLPRIVLIIDELGDLALAKGVDIETFLSRISNMARAVGIHMVVATQRPSVDVIVGKTKANFPTRIAFRVASKVDSRTILDTIGAEKLIGKGDMLHTDARHPEPVRLHGAYISEEELERVVSHWKSYEYKEPSSLDLFEERHVTEETEDKDPLFDEAREVILRYRQGSTSLLQRKLHIGYARAARLLDQMELAGIVGPPDSSKPREVLIKEREEIGPILED